MAADFLPHPPMTPHPPQACAQLSPTNRGGRSHAPRLLTVRRRPQSSNSRSRIKDAFEFQSGELLTPKSIQSMPTTENTIQVCHKTPERVLTPPPPPDGLTTCFADRYRKVFSRTYMKDIVATSTALSCQQALDHNAGPLSNSISMSVACPASVAELLMESSGRMTGGKAFRTFGDSILRMQRDDDKVSTCGTIEDDHESVVSAHSRTSSNALLPDDSVATKCRVAEQQALLNDFSCTKEVTIDTFGDDDEDFELLVASVSSYRRSSKQKISRPATAL